MTELSHREKVNETPRKDVINVSVSMALKYYQKYNLLLFK